MSGAAFGMPDILSPIGAFVIRTFDIGKDVAAGDVKKIVDGSPVLALFATPEDQPEDWLAVGCVLLQILLMLTADGATASYLNQPIEVEALRPQLREAVHCQGTPQRLLRFGYGKLLPRSVQRNLDDVII